MEKKFHSKRKKIFWILFISILVIWNLQIIRERNNSRVEQQEKLEQLQRIEEQKQAEQQKKDDFQKLLDGIDPLKEEEYIKTDEYNFAQLEKVKKILDPLDKDSKKFNTLSEFNKTFNQNIVPKEGCYYLSDNNGSEKYIFGFKLKSKKYISLYKEIYFAYPKYDKPEVIVCTGNCSDFVRDGFEVTIDRSCQDTISGYIYEDTNRNNIRDVGEKGIQHYVVKAIPQGGGRSERSNGASYDGYYTIPRINWGTKYNVQIEKFFGWEILSPTNGAYEIEFNPDNFKLGDFNFGLIKDLK